MLTCSTGVLKQAMEVIGEVSAEIFVRSSLPYADGDPAGPAARLNRASVADGVGTLAVT
ncbi:hypothetical protein [Nonomuraea sp. NPDC049480]|uniref:hypothetical protein n=1 Tax=Nonomuraea sp. NPDC049480 TaxID=3364353 RepID=UPI0037AB10ED